MQVQERVREAFLRSTMITSSGINHDSTAILRSDRWT